jgi:UDP-3-O-[3-hydroxymyristoyl] glucosamine N-acyltransferase
MNSTARTFQLRELVARFGGELRGPGEVRIRQVAPLDAAGPEEIAYLARSAFRKAAAGTGAGALIVAERDADRFDRPRIVVADPHAYFIKVAALLNPAPEPQAGVHPMAWVHPQAQVAPSAEVAAFVSIGAGAWIGEGVRLGPGCRIGAHARIGEHSRLHANVTIYDHCIVGRRAVMNAGCVIGSDGFGGALENGRWLKMPHIGRVVIGDDVEIGANTTIDRGAMADTVIEDGVKMDNLIQIGHNCRIGAHTTIAACAGIAGSAHIGSGCMIGGASRIVGHVHIADGVHVSPATVVTRGIEAPGRYTGIYPFSEHREWLRGAVQLRRLSETGEAAKERSRPRPKAKGTR